MRILNLIKSKKRISFGVQILLACALTILIRVFLDILYSIYVIKFYNNEFLMDISIYRYIESYFVLLLISVLIFYTICRKKKPSDIFVIFLFTLIFIPLTTLYGMSNVSNIFLYEIITCLILLLIILRYLPLKKIPRPGSDIRLLLLSIVPLISIYVYAWLMLTGGLERLNFDLARVYAVRAEYVLENGPFMGYFVSWQAYIFNIAIICYGFLRKNYWMVIIGFTLEFLLFGMTGHKSFLFSPFLAIAIFFIWQRKNAISLILVGIFLLLCGSYFLYLLSSNELIPAIFIRRMFFIPAKLHIIYYDFFSQPNNPLYMLSDSIFRYFMNNPYGQHMPEVIAQHFWGRIFWPDVGFLGDAYGNFGFAGMLVFSAIVGVILRIVDNFMDYLPAHFIASIMVMPFYALTESALLTTLFTHGLIVAVLVVWYFCSKKTIHNI